MNAVLMNGDTAISLVITMKEAQGRFDSLKGYYPNLSIKQTDQSIKEKFVYTGEAEEVEDVGCAGGSLYVMREWIKVSDRLPDNGVWVIGYVDGDMAETVSWNERNEMFENGFEWIEKVTHWMPLPEPPK